MATHIHFHPSEDMNFPALGMTGPKGPVGPRGPKGFTGPRGNVGPLTNTLTSYQNMFIVGNYEQSYNYSTDASNWKIHYRDNYTSSNPNSINSIAYGSNLWVAVGGNLFNDSAIQVSRDGYNWTPSSNGGFSGNYYNNGGGVAYGSNAVGSTLWITVGNGTSSIQVSTDGYNWIPSSNGGFSGDNYGYGVAYGSNEVGSTLWVAVGKSDSARSSIQISTDGYNWSNALSGGFVNGCYSVACGLNEVRSSLWVAVGRPALVGGISSIQVSTDGYNWQPSTTNLGFYDAGRSVAYGSNEVGSSLWVAIGADDGDPNTIQLSSNGYNWNSSFNGGFTTVGNDYLDHGYGVTYAGNLWVAVGNNFMISSTIQVSQDGSNWNVISNDNVITPRCVAYGRSQITTKAVAGSIQTNTLNDIPLADLEIMYQQWVRNGYDFTD